jgi:hypothetical protein
MPSIAEALSAVVGVGASSAGAEGVGGGGLPPLQPLTYNVEHIESAGARAAEDAGGRGEPLSDTSMCFSAVGLQQHVCDSGEWVSAFGL